MAQKFQTYRSLATVKARRVSDAEGENIVTRDGVRHVPKGDYITEDGQHVPADEFHGLYSSKKAPATETSEATPPVVAGTTDNAKTPDAGDTAKARVQATKATQSAKS